MEGNSKDGSKQFHPKYIVVWLIRCWCGSISVYCRTVLHTYTNKDLIYSATPPPY